jgi:hypothetical protein
LPKISTNAFVEIFGKGNGMKSEKDLDLETWHGVLKL